MARFYYECITETICNERTIAPAMKELVDKDGMEPWDAAKFVNKDSNGQVSTERAYLVWDRRWGKGTTDVVNGKSSRKQTKPDVKIQLEGAKKVIEKEDISDDDLKQYIGDPLAQRIANGKSAPRTGSRVATAVKKSHRKGVITPKPEPDNFQRLWNHVKAASEGLTYWADKTITPTTEDEAIAARGILMAGPSIIVQFARLGVDVVGIYETFVVDKERKNEKERKEISP